MAPSALRRPGGLRAALRTAKRGAAACSASRRSLSSGPPYGDIPVTQASVGRGTAEMVLAYPDMEPGELNKYSSVITKPKKQGAGQAQLYGTVLIHTWASSIDLRPSSIVNTVLRQGPCAVWNPLDNQHTLRQGK